MNQTHQVIGTCAAHISQNLRSRDSEVESPWQWPFSKHQNGGQDRGRVLTKFLVCNNNNNNDTNNNNKLKSLLQNLNKNPIYNQPAVTKNLINSSKHYSFTNSKKQK